MSAFSRISHLRPLSGLRIWILFALLGVLPVCSAEPIPRFVFLFIGDGMGEDHVRAADQFARERGSAVEGYDNAGGLAMLTLPERGTLSTFSKNQLVTDSAASASAFSTGRKVPGNALNYDSDLGVTYEPMAFHADRFGYQVAIISSAPVNHATPAGFYAVAPNRNDYVDIARQLPDSPVDYFGGEPLMGLDGEIAEIQASAVQNGFTLVEDRAGFDALGEAVGSVWVSSPMPYRVDAAHPISLADHTAMAIRLLRDGPGFFMMVEGAKVDWASHSNDGLTMIGELLEMDAAVAVAMEFLEEHPDETLIIVTSDHETGGLLFERDSETGPIVPVLESQQGSLAGMDSRFKAIEETAMRFDEALPMMQGWFGLTDLAQGERVVLEQAFTEGGSDESGFRYGGDKRLGHTLVRLVGARAGLQWTSFKHTADRVPLFAGGAQARRFAGHSDNALLGAALRELLEAGARQDVPPGELP
jgi:alkaline phosphatase